MAWKEKQNQRFRISKSNRQWRESKSKFRMRWESCHLSQLKTFTNPLASLLRSTILRSRWTSLCHLSLSKIVWTRNENLIILRLSIHSLPQRYNLFLWETSITWSCLVSETPITLVIQKYVLSALQSLPRKSSQTTSLKRIVCNEWRKRWRWEKTREMRSISTWATIACSVIKSARPQSLCELRSLQK